MEYDEKIAWLRRYRESLRREQLLEEEIEQLNTEARRVTRAIGGMPGGAGDGQAIPRAVEKLEETRQKLDAEIAAGQAVREQIAAAIAQVAHPLRRDILTRRYILGQRWEKISADHRRDLRWIFRVHRTAVEQLTIERH